MAFLQCSFYSKVLELKTNVNLILPENIRKKEKLKVLYLLHGYSGDATDWIGMTSIERYVKELGLVVVMPSVHNSYYNDMVTGLPYYTYISKELPKWIESVFPVSNKREDTFVCGLSMGGFGALKMAFMQPDRFIKAASLSGALNIANIKELSTNNGRKSAYFKAVFGTKSIKGTVNDLGYLVRKSKQEKRKLPSIYLACGTEDFLYEHSIKFSKVLKRESIDFTYEESKGDHDWYFWDMYIQKVLSWMFE